MFGEIIPENNIPFLKECNYIIKEIEPDGDAPIQFIKAYFFEEKSGIKKNTTASWPSCIAKTAEKWYPHAQDVDKAVKLCFLQVAPGDIEIIFKHGRPFFPKMILRAAFGSQENARDIIRL